MTAYPDTLLLINGTWREGSTAERIAVLNPATEEVIGHVAKATTDDLDAVAQAAHEGFQIWKATSAHERGKLMRKAAQLLRDRRDAIAPLMTMEQGKPLAQAQAEIDGSADILDWFAEEARRAYGQTIPARAPNVMQITIKDPVGPVAAFTPWNFPISQVVRKLGAALAAGCSIVVKAPEETPASPAALMQCFLDAGVPAGVVNLVYGIPAQISEHLTAAPQIAKISFTGSTAVGKHLAGLAGRHMKRSTMELGGHSPVLVFQDADIEATAALMAASKIRNSGQVCVSPTRFLIEAPVADRFTQAFKAVAEKVKIGNGLDPEVQMGPLANERRIPAMERMIEEALSKGARLVSGGRRIGNKGWFFEPTILADVPTSAEIMNEEPFGPVVIINRFTSTDEALAEANRLRYGLAAYAFTTSSATAARLRAEVRSGMLTINHLGLALPEVPFGGIGDSGYGTEGGSGAIEAYLDTRFVTQAL